MNKVSDLVRTITNTGTNVHILLSESKDIFIFMAEDDLA